MSVLLQTVSLAAQPRAFSSLLSLPSQAQSVIKALRRQGIGSTDEFNTARFFLSRLESLSALLQVFQIFRGRAGRDSVICSAPHSLLSTNPTDSPDTRFSVMAAVVLSGCMCQSRKDPYLPLEPQCVRLLPRPTGLPPMAFAVSFRIRFADAETAVKHHRPTHIRPLGPHHKCTLISRPTAVYHRYIYIESARRYSCYFTALFPMCIRLT